MAREDFTPERVAYFAEQAAKFSDTQFLSEAERERSRAATLAAHPTGEDFWIFGYGSLMWNPAVRVAESVPARVEGYRRNFCLRLMFGRGSPDNQDLMLCLVEGGSCAGIAHRIAAGDVESETRILWMREMLSGAYAPSWVELDIGGRKTRGVTFVINRGHARYVPGLSIEEKAARIARAEGHLGTNRDYLFRTVAALAEAGLSDVYIADIERAVRAKLAEETT